MFAFFEIKVILLLVDIVLIKHVLLYPTDLNSIFFSKQMLIKIMVIFFS